MAHSYSHRRRRQNGSGLPSSSDQAATPRAFEGGRERGTVRKAMSTTANSLIERQLSVRNFMHEANVRVGAARSRRHGSATKLSFATKATLLYHTCCSISTKRSTPSELGQHSITRRRNAVAVQTDKKVLFAPKESSRPPFSTTITLNAHAATLCRCARKDSRRTVLKKQLTLPENQAYVLQRLLEENADDTKSHSCIITPKETILSPH